MADRQNTTNITYGGLYSYGSWALGSSSTAGTQAQFPLTAEKLPLSIEVWPQYYAWVMRGDNDGDYDPYSTDTALPLTVVNDGSAQTFSRTFSENGPPDLVDVRVGGGGWPACPYQPSVAATDGIAGSYSYQNSAQGPVLGPCAPWPDETGATSLMSPDVGSESQHGEGAGFWPSYELGKWSGA